MPGYLGKVAVVTGAASGIGYAVAARAAAEGMTVVLADIDEGRLHDAAAALRGTGADVHSVWVDVSDRDSVTDLARRVRDDVGEAWLLVNNARSAARSYCMVGATMQQERRGWGNHVVPSGTAGTRVA